MFARHKINIALFICFAFVFRLLFVNFSLFANTLESTGPVAKRFSILQKSICYSETIVQSHSINYTTGDVFEEDSDDEEDIKKAFSTAVLPVLYTSFKSIALTIESNHPFDLKCDSYPKKYLAISSLRI